MFGEHRYRLQSTWTGNRGTGTTGYRDYDRSTTIEIDGKATMFASADKPFRGDPGKWNPEDMLLASLSQCHLLSYLHACVEAGVVVVAYRDEASGLMVENGRGGARFTEVTLRPHVTVADASMTDAAMKAHEQAHDWCFIANSVNFPVLHKPKIEVAQPA